MSSAGDGSRGKFGSSPFFFFLYNCRASSSSFIVILTLSIIVLMTSSTTSFFKICSSTYLDWIAFSIAISSFRMFISSTHLLTWNMSQIHQTIDTPRKAMNKNPNSEPSIFVSVASMPLFDVVKTNKPTPIVAKLKTALTIPDLNRSK